MLNSAGRRFGHAELQALGSLAVTLLIMAVLMFWPAGTLAWARGWWFLLFFIVLTVIAMAYLWRVNPEIFAARRRFQKGSKRWDVVVATLTMISIAAILPVAALDDGRFHWSPLPDWVVLIGYLLFAVSYAWIAQAQAVNRHFEPTVRIQTDRNHKVIDTGPYAFVRHPGYIGAAGFAIGMALALGSLWALIPAALAIIILAGRTLGEEAVLKAELPGYAEYMQRVRYRWVPGVW
jgi:protein-S-isoprenylcysteine O-methyltransferase Ste14